MPTLYLTRGIPGCGKSTETRQMVVESKGKMKRICKDEIRLMLDGTHKFGLEFMSFYNELITQTWKTALKNDFDVVLDETFIRVVDLRRVLDDYEYFAIQRNFEPKVVILDFTQQTFEETVRRDAARHPSLGYAVLLDYKEALEKEGSTCSIMESLPENFTRFTLVTTISSERRSNKASA